MFSVIRSVYLQDKSLVSLDKFPPALPSIEFFFEEEKEVKEKEEENEKEEGEREEREMLCLVMLRALYFRWCVCVSTHWALSC